MLSLLQMKFTLRTQCSRLKRFFRSNCADVCISQSRKKEITVYPGGLREEKKIYVHAYVLMFTRKTLV